MSVLLSVECIHTYYGQSHVLQGLSLEVGRGEVVSLLGRNGAGKTTTIRSIMGLTPPRDGTIRFQDRRISDLPTHTIFRLGIRLVPQGRRIFSQLTVEENLKLAMLHSHVRDEHLALEQLYDRFPRLRARRRNKGHHLSGGELQMLAVARALLGEPRLILLDEPSEGLAPLIVQEIRDMIKEIATTGVSILLAEQNVEMALRVAHRHVVIDKGQVRYQGSSAELEADSAIMEDYLGVSVNRRTATRNS